MDLLKERGTTHDVVSVALVNGNDSILFGARQYTPERLMWIPPGGRCNLGEQLEVTLRREVKEETGITDFQIEDYIGWIRGDTPGDRVFLYYATTPESHARLMEPDKFREWRWIPLREFLAPQDNLGILGAVVRETIKQFLRTKFSTT